MRFLHWVLCLILIFPLTVYARQQSGPRSPSKADISKAESTFPESAQAEKSEESNLAVDEAKVTGSTFESAYFHFTYELPKDWKALDDNARMTSNKELSVEEKHEAEALAQVPKKASVKKSAKPAASNVPIGPERYSLMAATPVGLESLADPVLPRINIWANRRVTPLDTPMDQAQLLLSGRRSTSLVRPHEVVIGGHNFAVVEIVNPSGYYQARYITELGDYLVGFDFLTQTEKELAEFSNTIKTVKFK